MKNKGFTLVELLLVVVIITIILVISIPNIMEALEESKKRGGESVENLIRENLKLYNSDNEEDLWCLDEEGFNCTSENSYSCLPVNPEDLYSLNSDIDMGECLFRDKNSLLVEKDSNGNYKYYADIVCGKDLVDANNDKIVDENSLETAELYYETENFPNNLKGNCGAK